MSDLAKRIAGLSPEKIRALQAQMGKKVARNAIPRAQRSGDSFPLSFAQKRIWFLHQLAPESPAYNNFLTVKVLTNGGIISASMMEKVINEIIRRHESMRTTFRTIDGAPVQVVHPSLPIRVDETSASSEDEALRLIREEYRRPFDIERGPLVRLGLIRLNENESIITYATHHLISDGWSQGIFLKENAALSGAFAMGMPSPLPELQLQYADYAVWQEEWLRGDQFRDMLAYWKQKLAGTLPILQLPADRPRPMVQDFEGKTAYRTIDAKFVKEFAKREGVSLFQTLLAALYVLFHRYTGDEDIVIGTPVANRARPEIENIYGFFVNTLALRTTFSPDDSFRALLAKVRTTAEGAIANQEMPFEKLVEELAPQRDLRFNPLFQVMFALQNAPMEVKSPGVTLVPMRVANDTAKFDVGLWAEEADDTLILSLGYRTALFDDAPMERMLAHYETLLRDALAHPEKRIASLTLPSSALRRWEGSPSPRLRGEGGRRPGEGMVLTLFAEAANKFPRRIAVTGEDGALTYAELDAQSTELAKTIKDTIVPIIEARTTKAIVKILAAWKAGAAYLPIDPDTPAERIETMLSIARHEDGRGLAYVIFTSGSTGTPKAVAIEHAQLANYVAGILPRLDPHDGATFATVSTFAADLGHTMIFPALASGGTLHVVPQERVTDPTLLAEWFASHPADFLKIVPSHLEAVLSANVLPRRTLVLGGEAASESLIQSIERLAPELRILNHYGPTETTVGVLTHDITRDRAITSNETMPIGTPLAGSIAYIVDREMQLVPDGIPGELLIGGDGVGRGYLGRPDLTAERFLSDPFSAREGARLYRTGDRVRRLESGAIQFLGRVDHQVKIRGHRIELGEIEATLRKFVDDAVVVLRDGKLIAYTVGKADRAALRTLLPEVMIPSTFVEIDALPLNANGKVDRNALPAPQAEERASETFVAPRNGLELSIARIWEEALDVKPVGVTDNFFDLGGHSLLAVRVATRIAKELSVELPIATMFQAGTIERLAQILGGSAAPSALTTAVAIQPQGTNAPLFFVHPAGGNVLCYYDLARQLGTQQPFYGLQVSDFGAGRERRSIEQMAAEYIAAMRDVQPHGPYSIGGWSMGGVVAFEMAKQLRAIGEDVALLAILDMAIPLGSASQVLDDEARAIAIYAQKLELFSGMSLGIDYAALAEIDPKERVARFARELQKTGLVPQEIGAEALGRFLEFQQGHSRVTLEYRPSPIAQRITLIRGSEKLELRDQVELQGLAELHHDPALGWQPFSTEPVDVRWVPGNHITMMTRPNVKELAATLAAVIGETKETLDVVTTA